MHFRVLEGRIRSWSALDLRATSRLRRRSFVMAACRENGGERDLPIIWPTQPRRVQYHVLSDKLLQSPHISDPSASARQWQNLREILRSEIPFWEVMIKFMAMYVSIALLRMLHIHSFVTFCYVEWCGSNWQGLCFLLWFDDDSTSSYLALGHREDTSAPRKTDTPARPAALLRAGDDVLQWIGFSLTTTAVL